MSKKLTELAKEIISHSHENCEMWEEEHETDLQALDNSHESFWLEFVEDGEYENLFTEAEFYKAFNVAYDLVNKGDV